MHSLIPQKKCFKCDFIKPLVDFYKHPQMADGHVNKCKECNKDDITTNRNANLDRYREYDNERYKKPERKEASILSCKAARKRSPERYAGYIKAWQERNPHKRSANNAVSNAVRDGRISKPAECSKCGLGGVIHGHHDDYSKPLEVVWVCPPCHSDIHKTIKQAVK